MSFLARLKSSTRLTGLLIAAAIVLSAPYGAALLTRSGVLCAVLTKAGTLFSKTGIHRSPPQQPLVLTGPDAGAGGKPSVPRV